MTSVLDQHQRPLRNLRLSVTDRCNLRCAYCMPEEDYGWLPKPEILSFEELGRLVDAFTRVGVDRVRLTGGEPLVRRDLPELVALLAAKPALVDLALTTNATLLDGQAQALRDAGLKRITVSLDTLRPERFQALTRRDALPQVLRGIEAAQRAFGRLKLDTVVIRGVNDDELLELLDFGQEHTAEVRFIEYMDVGGATRWSAAQVVSRAEILARVGAARGEATPLDEQTSAPADRYRLPDGQVFGIISSTTQPFCMTCDRSRVTADGHWYRCLYAVDGTDLRAPLRAGESVEALAERLRVGWSRRADRGAMDRRALADRRPLVQLGDLRRDPRLEMHTRGG